MSQIEQTNMIEEDEIDLRELWKTVVAGKKFIIIFTIIVTFIVLVMQLAKPNVYESKTILVSQGQSGGKSLGGLGALAGLAGVSLGGGSELAPSAYLEIILNDYDFNVQMIKKYKLDSLLLEQDKDLVFALGIDSVYNLSHSTSEEKPEMIDTYNTLMDMITLDEDKKSGTITLSVQSTNRTIAKKILEIYLVEMTNYYRNLDMQEVEKQLGYYETELEKTDDVQLKTELSGMVSSLVQKKVLAQANKYYMFKQVTKPRVAEVKEKVAPKRGLVVVVAFVTSIILSIFIIFFREFLSKNRDETV